MVIIDQDTFVDLVMQLQAASTGLLAAIRTLEPAEDEAVVSAVEELLAANDNIGNMAALFHAVRAANWAERPDPRTEGTQIS